MSETFRAPRGPWHRSAVWQLATAYFKVGGLAAWDTNTVPSYATSNVLSARRIARLLVAVAEHHPGPFAVLELGAGHGRFAANVLDALRDDAPAIYERMTYVIADLARDNVRALLDATTCIHAERGRASAFVARHVAPPKPA